MKDATKPIAENLIRRMLNRVTGRPVEEAAIALSPAQITAIHEASYAKAIALGLRQDRATLLADAVVGSVHRSNG